MAWSSPFSLHPKLAALIDAVAGILFTWWFVAIGHGTSSVFLVLWLLARAGWWAGLVRLVYFPPILGRIEQWFSLVLFAVGMLFFLLFIDVTVLRVALMILAIAIPLVSSWLIPERPEELSALAKPLRRWRFAMMIFGVAGLWSGIGALAAFQALNGPTLVMAVVSAVILTGLTSYLGWHLYGLPQNMKLVFALVALMALVAQVGYAVFMWPAGYFVGSFILTWLWYLLWLLLRFALTPEGVDWRRQRIFLIVNGLLLVLFLSLLVRWK